MRTTRRSRMAADTSALDPTTTPSVPKAPILASNSSGPACNVRFRSKDDIRLVERGEDTVLSGKTRPVDRQHTASTSPRIRSLQSQSPLPVGNNQSTMYRLGAMMFLLVAVVPLLHSTSFFGHASMPMRPVSGGVIPEHPVSDGVVLDRRKDSPTAVCKRWAQMSAIVNGTLYLYGGQATLTSTQDSNTWNNDFLSLDLTQSTHTSIPRCGSEQSH